MGSLHGHGRNAWIGRFAVAAATIAAAPLHAAPPAPAAGDYPASSSEAAILDWIASRTSMSRRTILAVGPKAVVALVSVTPKAAGDTTVDAELRAELIGSETAPKASDAAAKGQERSVLFSLQLDCAARRVRIVGRTTYALPDLKGRSQSDSQPRAWAAVDDAAPVGKAWKAACTQGFVFPYAPQAPAVAPAPPAGPRAYEVVLGSFAEPGNAQAAAKRVNGALRQTLAGRTATIRTITVNGRVYAVVAVGGFDTAEAAGAFCGEVRKLPLECLVKRTASAAQTPRIQPSSDRAVSASSAARP